MSKGWQTYASIACGILLHVCFGVRVNLVMSAFALRPVIHVLKLMTSSPRVKYTMYVNFNVPGVDGIPITFSAFVLFVKYAYCAVGAVHASCMFSRKFVLRYLAAVAVWHLYVGRRTRARRGARGGCAAGCGWDARGS
jgi:hypothetical protein